MTTPRPEYPRPQFVRDEWLCLNGEWQFEIDPGDSGLERGLRERELGRRIVVPFCPESALSGVGNVDFMLAVWYRRTVTIPQSWGDRRVLLHFGAVDYDATVWVNGVEVGRHRGGFTPFACDLHGVAGPGDEASIVVRARDDWRPPQPRGKQSGRYENHGCHYTRTTGIWQTVWMEPVAHTYLLRPRITPHLDEETFYVSTSIGGVRRTDLQVSARISADGQKFGQTYGRLSRDFTPQLDVAVLKRYLRPWSPQDPFLYDIDLELTTGDGEVLDRLRCYAGLRSITIDGKAIEINRQPIFQRLVLDQGFYPDGILTAPTDEALKRDIELSIAAGFNGARLHQKVFEERFLYWADKLGYLVWGEFPDWGCNGYGVEGDNQQPTASYVTQWLEAIERDYSHPSIVGWCPLNETTQKITDRITVLDDVTRAMCLATKAMDTTRPVLDTSGYSHRVSESDVYDSHDYDQNPETFKGRHAGLAENRPYLNTRGANKDEISIGYRGQPYFVSEFGGIWWNPSAKPGEASWGYGNRPQSIEEFYARFEGLCDALLDDPNMFGYCYTQLNDVYQEQNGIYTFDRKAKFDMERIRKAQTRKAAIEAAGR